MKPNKEELLNLSVQQIRERYYVTEKTALRWLGDYGMRSIKPRLTKKQVVAIRASDLPIKTLADQYNVSLATIYRIKNNQTHKVPKVCCSGGAVVSMTYNEHLNIPQPRAIPCAVVDVIRSSSNT